MFGGKNGKGGFESFLGRELKRLDDPAERRKWAEAGSETSDGKQQRKSK